MKNTRSHSIKALRNSTETPLDHSTGPRSHHRGKLYEKGALTWTPSTRAASIDGTVVLAPAHSRSSASSAGPARALLRHASSVQAMRKATSWIDLRSRVHSTSLWQENDATEASSSKVGKSTPHSDEAWAACDKRVTLPYSMGSTGDLVEAVAGSATGSGSASLSPQLTAPAQSVGAGAGSSGGLVKTGPATPAGPQPFDEQLKDSLVRSTGALASIFQNVLQVQCAAGAP